MPNVYFSQKILTTALLKEIVNKQKNGICKVQNWLLGYPEKIQQLLFKSYQLQMVLQKYIQIHPWPERSLRSKSSK